MSRAIDPRLALILAGCLFLPVPRTIAGEGGRVNNLKVLSDQVDDVSSVEAILKSFLHPGMSEQERARAIWTAAIKYRHQSIPPNEFLAADWEAHDPVKIFNVYGYCMCCCSSAIIEALNRADGREARGRILNGHSVPEVWYGGAWHMDDASLITYFPKPGRGVDASVDEIAKSVIDWYAGHPGFREDRSKLAELMRRDGWLGWKADGPALLAACPWYRLGFFPAGTHGWNDTMVEYDRKSEVYEYGYQVGHRAVFSLRPGEWFDRRAGNWGLHINREEMPDWDALKARAPEGDLAYLKDFLPGYKGGVVGNGTHRYEPDLASGGLAIGSEVYENLATGGRPAMHLKEGGKPGVAVVPMISPYVYLGGRIKVEAACRRPGDRVQLSISTDNGRSFRQIGWFDDRSRPEMTVIDISDSIIRRYAYWLRVEVESSTVDGAGLVSLALENDIQHAPRTLPRLARGRTTITVDADGDPAMATRTISCRITADPSFRKNETARGMGVVLDNVREEHDAYWWKGGTATVTVPIEVPGDLQVLRFSAQVRARGSKDRVRMLASHDGGRSWREVGQIVGPTQGKTGSFRFADWPSGTRSALLRFEMTGENTVGVLSFRVDADHRDPIASARFRPFRVVHYWIEDGMRKSHAEVIRRVPMTYSIETKSDPATVSVLYGMPVGPEP